MEQRDQFLSTRLSIVQFLTTLFRDERIWTQDKEKSTCLFNSGLNIFPKCSCREDIVLIKPGGIAMLSKCANKLKSKLLITMRVRNKDISHRHSFDHACCFPILRAYSLLTPRNILHHF